MAAVQMGINAALVQQAEFAATLQCETRGKRARAAPGSDSARDDDTLGGSSGPPQTKVKVEVGSASDLKHTACGLLRHGAGGSGGGGRQREASTEPGSQAPRLKKVKTAARSTASNYCNRSKFLSFDAARTLVRALKMWSVKEWLEYSKSGERPSNVPGNPDKTYRGVGWVSMPDWMGYAGKESMAPGGALSFVPARTFVRTLKLRSRKEWKEYSKSGKRPSNIPSSPDKLYRGGKGWISWPDWLGYEGKEVMAPGGALSFVAARTFVRTLKLRSMKEWHAYSKSGKRPSNIPGSPDKVYRDAGWISMPDWLGYGGKPGRGRQSLDGKRWLSFERQQVKSQQHVGEARWLSFEAARTFVRTLELGSQKEWKAYTKSNTRPSNIPSCPNKVYSEAGWISMPDWLGYEQMEEGKGAICEEAAAMLMQLMG